MRTKRIFDLLFALIGILLLMPVFILVICILKLDSKGAIFYQQERVGLHLKNFNLIKFRTMRVNSDKLGLLTVGAHDRRITRFGYWLRKYKFDELPQLINIIRGEMSFVGPRPEVCKYVEMYNQFQKRVFSVKPGITDWASIRYINESELLATSDDPEEYYVHTLIPAKLDQNLAYVDHHNFWIDMKIISYTLKSIVFR